MTDDRAIDRAIDRESDRDRTADLQREDSQRDDLVPDAMLRDDPLDDDPLDDPDDPDDPDGPDAPKGPARLQIENLVVAFGGVRAVAGVSLDVEPGTLVGLVGPNGSGKTTLLDAVSGFVRCAEGAVKVDGEDIVDHLPEERAQLGIVRSFQDCRLYPELTVEDTLLVCEDTRKRSDVISTTLRLPWARKIEKDKHENVDRVIASFGLERFRNHRTNQLSTGTRRVVDLASIVLSKPRLLLLDEPTAGIAQREAEAFIPLLRRLQQVTEATVLLVEHDVPLVFELCSKVVVMETGQVVSSGPPDEVSRDPRALAAYLGASDEALLVSGPTAAKPLSPATPATAPVTATGPATATGPVTATTTVTPAAAPTGPGTPDADPAPGGAA